MVAYASNELIPSSDFAKRFGSYLAQITSDTVDKLAILKNKHVEAVIVSKDEYERMKIALDEKEHREIYELIQKRKETPLEDSISFDEMAKKLNIDTNNL